MPFVAAEPALVWKFKGASLVIADVSRGNVGQVSCEHLSIITVGKFMDNLLKTMFNSLPPIFSLPQCRCAALDTLTTLMSSLLSVFLILLP
jgi:hypothetical protein